VSKWLELLARDGRRQAVGSSAPKANVDLVLDVTRTLSCFQVIITGGDMVKGKPDPEVYFAAAVVVEDAPEAIRASVKAGIKTVGVLRGGALSQGADVEVASLEQLSAGAFE